MSQTSKIEIMKTMQNWISQDYTPFIIGKKDEELSLIKAEKKHHQLTLQIAGSCLKDNNYRLFIKGKYLTIVLIEEKLVARPIYVHNLNWQQSDYSGYEKVKTFDIFLPGDNFYLIRHSFLTKDHVLNVILGQEYY
jgi:hypothetical protein